jgi:hypothetical protein
MRQVRRLQQEYASSAEEDEKETITCFCEPADVTVAGDDEEPTEVLSIISSDEGEKMSVTIIMIPPCKPYNITLRTAGNLIVFHQIQRRELQLNFKSNFFP